MLENLASPVKEVQIEVLQVLIELLKCPELTESFSHFIELIVLKVLHAHKFDDPTPEASAASGRAMVKQLEVSVLFVCVFSFVISSFLFTSYRTENSVFA